MPRNGLNAREWFNGQSFHSIRNEADKTEPELVAPAFRGPARQNGSCHWCRQRLENGELYYHRDCALAAEGKL